jgi:hypothetical protein
MGWYGRPDVPIGMIIRTTAINSTKHQKEAKFLCSLFARFGTSTTRGLRIRCTHSMRALSLIPAERNH